MSIKLTKDNKTISLTKEVKSNKFILGAGWDVGFFGKAIDLDLSLIPLFSVGISTDLITYFGNLNTVYAQHSGDNRTGKGSGDDETIHVDLDKLPPNINSVFASLYCYSSGTFGKVKNEHFKLYDGNSNLKIEIYMDQVQASKNATHLFPIKFVRNGSEWNVELIGRYDVLPNQDINSVINLAQTI